MTWERKWLDHEPLGMWQCIALEHVPGVNLSAMWASTGDRKKLTLNLPWHLSSGSYLHSYVLSDNRKWSSYTEHTVPEGSEEVGGWLIMVEGND